MKKIASKTLLGVFVCLVFMFLIKNDALSQTCEKGNVVCPEGQVACCEKFKPHCKDGEAKCCKKKKDGSGLKCHDKEGNTYPVECKESCSEEQDEAEEAQEDTESTTNVETVPAPERQAETIERDLNARVTPGIACTSITTSICGSWLINSCTKCLASDGSDCVLLSQSCTCKVPTGRCNQDSDCPNSTCNITTCFCRPASTTSSSGSIPSSSSSGSTSSSSSSGSPIPPGTSPCSYNTTDPCPNITGKSCYQCLKSGGSLCLLGDQNCYCGLQQFKCQVDADCSSYTPQPKVCTNCQCTSPDSCTENTVNGVTSASGTCSSPVYRCGYNSSSLSATPDCFIPCGIYNTNQCGGGCSTKGNSCSFDSTGTICTCIPPCSSTNLTGWCSTGQKCVNGACIPPCSSTNLTGWCPTGQICFNGTCTTPCANRSANSCSTGAESCPTGQTCAISSSLTNCSCQNTSCSYDSATASCKGLCSTPGQGCNWTINSTTAPACNCSQNCTLNSTGNGCVGYCSKWNKCTFTPNPMPGMPGTCNCAL